MTDRTNCHEVARRLLVYDTDQSQSVLVTRNLVYRSSGGRELHFDVYRCHTPTASRRPAVLLTTGFRDHGIQKAIGCHAKDMQSYESWGRLLAATGVAAVTYVNDEPVSDARAILEHLRENAETLQIDAGRIGVWACSGNVPTALSLLMSGSAVSCAALLYGYMLDVDGSTGVRDAARTWHFANPTAGRHASDLPADLPLLVVRAGCDSMAGLNDSIDRFTTQALEHNLPLTLVNLPNAHHAFDTVDVDRPSRLAIRCVLDFLRRHTSEG